MFSTAIYTIQLYAGSFICLTLMVLCMIYTIFKCNSYKLKQTSFACAIIFVVLMNPIVLNFLINHRFEDARIAKVYCVLPIYLVISLILAHTIKNFKQLIAIMVILILTGSLCITPDSFSYSTNVYKLDQKAVNVSTLISYDATESNITPKLLVTAELVCDIRQYDPSLLLEVGRNVSYDFDSAHQSDLQEAIAQPQLDVALIESMCLEDNCTYIVFDSWKSLSQDFTSYSFFTQIDGYYIYKIAQ